MARTLVVDRKMLSFIFMTVVCALGKMGAFILIIVKLEAFFFVTTFNNLSVDPLLQK